MTLLIKSDKAASKHLGNIYGVSGAYDFTALFDFERAIYKKRNTVGLLDSISLSDALVVEQDRSALYYSADGLWRTANPNTPRIHYIADVGKSGLLVESYKLNLFLNSDAPVTQTISASYADPFVLRVTGTGSATVSGAVGNVTGNAEASDGVNVYGVFTNGSVTVAVTGSPDRVELYRVLGTAGSQVDFTPVVTQGSATEHKGDVVKLSSQLFTDALTGSEGTIVAQVTTLPFDSTGLASSQGVRSALTLHDSDPAFSGRFLMADLTNGNAEAEQRLAGSTSEDGSSKVSLAGSRTFTLAMSYNGDIVSVSHNGLEDSSTVVGMAEAAKLVLGARLSTNANYNISAALDGVINKLAIFDREIAPTEFKELSKSWL